MIRLFTLLFSTLKDVRKLLKEVKNPKEKQLLMRVNVQCPQCKGKKLYVEEVWNEAVKTWETEDGKINLKRVRKSFGKPVRVEGLCLNLECLHRWTMRNKTSIIHLHYIKPEDHGSNQ